MSQQFRKWLIIIVIVGALFGAMYALMEAASPRPFSAEEERLHRAATGWQRTHPDEYREMRDSVEHQALHEE